MTRLRRARVSIQRFLPETDTAPRWQSYEIETAAGMTVLEALHQIREQIDATLAWRYSCRMGVCGSCAMVINGKPALACNTQIRDVSESHIRLQPLSNFPIVKDLVTDLQPMFDQHRRLKPYLIRSDVDELKHVRTELQQSPDELLEYMQFSYCIKCGACVAACPTVAMDRKFPGPMPLTAAQRYNADSRDDGFGLRETALAEGHGLAHCHYAGECSRVCPKGVDPALAIQLLKREQVAGMFRTRRRDPAPPVSVPQGGDSKTGAALRPPDFTVTRGRDGTGPDGES